MSTNFIILTNDIGQVPGFLEQRSARFHTRIEELPEEDYMALELPTE